MAKRKSDPSPTTTTTITSETTEKELESFQEAKIEDILDEINNMVDSEPSNPAKRPILSRLTNEINAQDGTVEGAAVPIPRNRIKALKENWEKIYDKIVKRLYLQVRFNVKNNHVEMRKCAQTKEEAALHKASDFIKAFALGFEVDDAMALLRIDELFLDTFKVTDVKGTLKGDHLARAIGRIAGTGGRNKNTIENVTKTRIVLADQRITILGSFQNIRTARRAICAVIMGTPNNKIHGTLRSIAERMGDRY